MGSSNKGVSQMYCVAIQEFPSFLASVLFVARGGEPPKNYILRNNLQKSIFLHPHNTTAPRDDHLRKWQELSMAMAVMWFP